MSCNCFHFHYVAFLFYAHPSILIDIEFVDTFFAIFSRSLLSHFEIIFFLAFLAEKKKIDFFGVGLG